MKKDTSIFYEVRQRTNNGQWMIIGFFQDKKGAEKYKKLHNTKSLVSPIEIQERQFFDIKDF